MGRGALVTDRWVINYNPCRPLAHRGQKAWVRCGGTIAAVNPSASHPVIQSLAPVFLLIGLGYLAGRLQWIRDAAVKDLSNLVFLLLIPALLFRTMSAVRFQDLDGTVLLAYFAAAWLLFFAVVWRQGLNRRGIAVALASVFSNMVMIGIALIELAYGKAGLVTLLTLVSVHALILLTGATVVFEVAVARELRATGGQPRPLSHTVLLAIKSSLIHPIPLPILCGLLYAQFGVPLPGVVDKPLQLLGSAFGPIALVLVGVTMSRTPVGGLLREAVGISVVKNLVLPALVFASAWLLGIQGLALTVMVVAAALPIGANVFLFSQRYEVAQDLVTASVGVSTGLALVTLSLVMLAVSWL